MAPTCLERRDVCLVVFSYVWLCAITIRPSLSVSAKPRCFARLPEASSSAASAFDVRSELTLALCVTDLRRWSTSFLLGTPSLGQPRDRDRDRERERERETKGFRFWICIQMKFKEWEMELGLSRSVLHRSNYRVFIGKQSLVGECFSCVTLLGKSA